MLFVDHQTAGRSGHGNQALIQCGNGDLLSFYSDTSGEIMHGHSNTGWTEYRKSTDGGLTWSCAQVLPFSFSKGDDPALNSCLVEEAVTAPDGTVIVFIGRYITYNWHRTTPVVLLSPDNGNTWSEPRPVDPAADIHRLGRMHGVVVKDREILCLFDSGTHNSRKNGSGHKLYGSSDNGRTFQHRSDLPFRETAWYGTLGSLGGSRLIAYVYNDEDEINTEYAISEDLGRTWGPVKKTKLAKGLRNPQLSGEIDGIYYLHGRSGHRTAEPANLVLYRSANGVDWDEGTFLNYGPKDDADSYSTNEIVRSRTGAPASLLIQSSVAYDGKRRVNLHHWRIGPPPRP